MIVELPIGEVKQRAAGVLPLVELNDVRVVHLEADGFDQPDGQLTVRGRLSVFGSQTPTGVQVEVRYEVSASGREDEDSEPDITAWAMKLRVVGDWLARADPLPEQEQVSLDCFAVAIGVMTIHPYARECVQSTSTRLGYPPYTRR